MFIKFYSITFIVFLLFFLDNNINFKSYAISISSDDQHNSEREQLTHYPNNNTVNLPSKGSGSQYFYQRYSWFFFLQTENNFWIATGNWNMDLKNNIPLFNLNMTWYNNKEFIPRTYHIFNFVSFNTKVGSLPDSILFTNGTISISLKWSNNT